MFPLRRPFIKDIPESDRKCSECASPQTYTDKKGHPRWYWAPGGREKLLCNRCSTEVRMALLKERRKRIGIIGGMRHENTSCYACGSTETYVTPTSRYAVWHYNDCEGNALCHRCYRELYVTVLDHTRYSEVERNAIREQLREILSQKR